MPYTVICERLGWTRGKTDVLELDALWRALLGGSRDDVERRQGLSEPISP